MNKANYRKFIDFLGFYTLVVILWGAFVRISGSGDGCGKSWPLCNESFVPQTTSIPTWIEFSHRLSSGLYGIFVLFLVYWSFKVFEKGHVLRKLSVLTLFLTLTEALLGARLVLAGLVSDNASVTRAYTMALHLANSFLLMASIVVQRNLNIFKMPRFSITSKQVKYALFGSIALLLAVGMSGAIAALSTTLFPSESLLAGFADDFNPNSHFLVRVRASHPIMAIVLGAALYALAGLFSRESVDAYVNKWISFYRASIASGIVIGLVTLFSLSPLALKLIHLTWAYAIWTGLFICFANIGFKESK